LRWSAQACGPDGVGTPVPFGIVLLCRRDRRHGKPGGLLHLGWRNPVDGRAAGEGGPGRLESLPHKNGRRPGGLPHKNSLTYNRRGMLFAGSMVERLGRMPQVCVLPGRVRSAVPRGGGKNQALARAFRRAVSLDL